MPRSPSLPERGMEAQVVIRETRRACAPLYEAAMASGDYAVMSETKQLAETLALAGRQAKRLTGYAEGIACPDGRLGLFHGEAA